MESLIDRLDHLVLTVADSDRTVRFYSDILGMQVEIFGDNRLALRFGDQKINIHTSGKEIKPHATTPLPGSADLCFISSVPIAKIIDHLQEQGVAIELGPVPRTGSLGPLVSVYIRDPDGNLVEIANQTGLHAKER